MSDKIILVCAVVGGILIVIIPFIIALIKFVKEAAQGKDWKKLIGLLFNLICEAEKLYETGAEKKEWVMALAKKAAEEIGYEINEAELSDLIDKIVAVTKLVNIK